MTPPRQRHTGALKLRRRVWWMRYYHKGERVEESTGQTHGGKAERVLRAKLKDADTERFVPPAIRKITFETLMDRVVREHARRGNGSRLTGQLAHLATAFQGWPNRGGLRFGALAQAAQACPRSQAAGSADGR
jgi:hypothetical protein